MECMICKATSTGKDAFSINLAITTGIGAGVPAALCPAHGLEWERFAIGHQEWRDYERSQQRYDIAMQSAHGRELDPREKDRIEDLMETFLAARAALNALAVAWLTEKMGIATPK